MKTIPELKAEIKELKAQIAPLHDRVMACEADIMEMLSPFKVGDLITWDAPGRKGRVEEIRRWVADEPMWIVRNILKDGMEGKTSEIHGYQHPKIAP